jgi:hypothetical protein
MLMFACLSLVSWCGLLLLRASRLRLRAAHALGCHEIYDNTCGPSPGDVGGALCVLFCREFEGNLNPVAARQLMQSGLRQCPDDPGLWSEYFRMVRILLQWLPHILVHDVVLRCNLAA